MSSATEAHLIEGELLAFNANPKQRKISEISIRHTKACIFQKGNENFWNTVNI